MSVSQQNTGSAVVKTVATHISKKLMQKLLVSAPFAVIGSIILIILGVLAAMYAVIFIAATHVEDTPKTDTGVIMMPSDGKGGKANVPWEVRRYEPMIQEIATRYGLGDYVEFFLAQVMQESGGNDVDIFQSSESIDGNLGNIRSPEQSTEQAMKDWTNVLTIAHSYGLGFYESAQAYNMGPGYLVFLNQTHQKYSEDTAKAFSLLHATSSTCGWRSPYCYGDYTYISKILKNFQPATSEMPSPVGSQVFQKVMNVALQYRGWPYVWSGDNPNDGFDCSGLWEWSFGKIGIYLPRTAQEQYNYTTRITKDQLQPGDMIFFHTADYNVVTHVGIYVGNNQMYDSDNSGINYHELNFYWTSKIVGYGRMQGVN